MGCICDKEVLFFGESSRDTSLLLYLFLTVYRHDLIGLKNRRFCPVENDWKGKNGLNLGQPTTFSKLENMKDFTKVPFPVTFPLERTVLHHVPFCNVPFRNTYRFVTVTVL
jgi:hypothetical protein